MFVHHFRQMSDGLSHLKSSFQAKPSMIWKCNIPFCGVSLIEQANRCLLSGRQVLSRCSMWLDHTQGILLIGSVSPLFLQFILFDLEKKLFFYFFLTFSFFFVTIPHLIYTSESTCRQTPPTDHLMMTAVYPLKNPWTVWSNPLPTSTLKYLMAPYLMVPSRLYPVSFQTGDTKTLNLSNVKTASQINVSFFGLTFSSIPYSQHTLVVRVTYQPTDFSVLVRAYGKGSELIIDRKQEVVVSNLPLIHG